MKNDSATHPDLLETYRDKCQTILEDLPGYWSGRAETLVSWFKKWDAVVQGNFGTGEATWFAGAELNASYNCLDRHLGNGRRNKAAVVWIGDNHDESRTYTYQMLHVEVCRLAGVLRKKGIGRGDCVVMYLPMIPELIIAMLACVRIGAVHCVVFSGFSSASLARRMQDCRAKMLITADVVNRGGQTTPLKPNADDALEECERVDHCLVVRRNTREVSMTFGRDSWWHEEILAAGLPADCAPEPMAAEDTLFALYTSGSTGKPKKVVHTTGGYLTYAIHTCREVFNITDEDIFWCTADIGWITGHSYVVYGPLGLGATVLIHEGTPLYPGPDRYWEIVEKFRVTIFYTAPTVIRALMRFGEKPAAQHDLSSLRLLGSVGEPIDAAAWHWYHKTIGGERLPIVDTWWQTETGGIMISPSRLSSLTKPGAAAFPLPGIDAAIVDEEGREVGPEVMGRLVIRKPWPGMASNLHDDHRAQRPTRSAATPALFDTGDGARCDRDGYFFITGRLDDVINVNGHRLGTAEVESALLTHASVAEAAVVGKPHPIKGQAVYAYVTLKNDVRQTPRLLEELRLQVGLEIGAFAMPEAIQCTYALPKTRSGKIMRRVLKRIAADDAENLGDVSNIADLAVLTDLIEGSKVASEMTAELLGDLREEK